MPVTEEEIVARARAFIASSAVTVEEQYLKEACRRSLTFLEVGPAAVELELEHAARVAVAVEGVADLLRAGRSAEDIVTSVPSEQLALVKQVLSAAG